MGTYLNLELKNKSERHIESVNQLWNEENQGYENKLRFRTRNDIELDIEAVHTDPKQTYLRYIKTVDDWNKYLPVWAQGKFQVKITMGDYLCSEMARRYIKFVEAHEELFVKKPDEHVWFILQEKAETNEKAEECLAECPFCKGT